MTSSNAPAVRTVGGREVPAAGTWQIDPAHTTAQFVARHLMVSKVRGGFPELTGTIEIGEDPLESSVAVTIQVAGVDTGSTDRDNHLRSADFFDVENHPTMRFASTGVRRAGDRWQVDGDLTIRGVTRPVTLDVEFLGTMTDPWGNTKAGFSATADVDREEWGLTWNAALEGGGVLVSKKIKLEIEAQAALS